MARFTVDLGLLDWPGAWPEIFQEIVRVGFVQTSIRLAFCAAWRGEIAITNGSDMLAERTGWSLTQDFDEQPDLLVAELWLLMPETAVTRPVYALYRGQSVAEHQAGWHGRWWAPEPVHFELFGSMPNTHPIGAGCRGGGFMLEDAIPLRSAVPSSWSTRAVWRTSRS